jgi:23S rRNA (guanine745-N1)-methyltransferase
MALICPVCRERLERLGQCLTCCNRHSFDVAHEGYVNLLRTKVHGDTRDMVAARRRFLDRGHYATIADAVSREALSHLTACKAGHLLDSGCGEGYYLGSLLQRIAALPEVAVHATGIDASRDAVRAAARRYPDVTFAVSDVHDLIPVEDGSVDVLLDIFAPRNALEYRRVLTLDGLVIVVIPQPDHLVELRDVVPLLGIQPDKATKIERDFSRYFHPVHRVAVSRSLALSEIEVRDLVAMSPSARHLHLPDPLTPAPISVRMAVEILTFRPRAHAAPSR